MNAPRLATPRDIDGLLRLMEAFNAGEGIPWKPARTREALLKLFSAPDLGFVVLMEGASTPSAYAVITYNFDLEFGGLDCMLTEIFVSPALRGRGVAGKLLEQAEAFAKQGGAAAMSLAVRPENRSARQLYERRGFEAPGRIMLFKLLD